MCNHVVCAVVPGVVRIDMCDGCGKPLGVASATHSASMDEVRRALIGQSDLLERFTAELVDFSCLGSIKVVKDRACEACTAEALSRIYWAETCRDCGRVVGVKSTDGTFTYSHEMRSTILEEVELRVKARGGDNRLRSRATATCDDCLEDGVRRGVKLVRPGRRCRSGTASLLSVEKHMTEEHRGALGTEGPILLKLNGDLFCKCDPEGDSAPEMLRTNDIGRDFPYLLDRRVVDATEWPTPSEIVWVQGGAIHIVWRARNSIAYEIVDKGAAILDRLFASTSLLVVHRR